MFQSLSCDFQRFRVGCLTIFHKFAVCVCPAAERDLVSEVLSGDQELSTQPDLAPNTGEFCSGRMGSELNTAVINSTRIHPTVSQCRSVF